jgi:hypothetical protein
MADFNRVYLSKLDIFFKKNEEVISSVHLLTHLLKSGEIVSQVLLNRLDKSADTGQIKP